ncbi:uncharacterized protein [Choristoneura fumiferana]|uniref:uncharacterized protein n=1 Tax=Choristoneura fumiferana TaxID=7141 RepID=UPI003D15AA41
MDECKATSTPIEPGLTLEADKSTKDKELPYKNLIGTLMYLAVATRPDIMFAVSYLSQFNDSYSAEHFKSAKRVLRYLKGTSSIGLNFKRTEQELYGMADADWGACKLDRKSFSGYCFIYAGGCISWSSRKQKSVALLQQRRSIVRVLRQQKKPYT